QPAVGVDRVLHDLVAGELLDQRLADPATLEGQGGGLLAVLAAKLGQDVSGADGLDVGDRDAPRAQGREHTPGGARRLCARLGARQEEAEAREPVVDVEPDPGDEPLVLRLGLEDRGVELSLEKRRPRCLRRHGAQAPNSYPNSSMSRRNRSATM